MQELPKKMPELPKKYIGPAYLVLSICLLLIMTGSVMAALYQFASALILCLILNGLRRMELF